MIDSLSSKHILVTGGCGYIGSHTLVYLLKSPNNYIVHVADNLINSCNISLDRVVKIVGLDEETRAKRLFFYNVDLTDKLALESFFSKCPKMHACIHFASLKAVGESSRMPLQYYSNNITGALNLLDLLGENGCRNFVFSSSATVYGSTATVPITEDSPVNGNGITNPYGRTKFMIEEILKDLHSSDKSWNINILRYFNPAGAHPSGLIGEDPNGIPNNLMPYVTQVAVGRREYLTIFGNDYDTEDGTGVRDYLHVMDLAEGHLKAIEYMERKSGGIYFFNLGTGKGSSVLDIVNAMQKACGHEIKYKIGERREGDLACVYADADKAKREMGWVATRTLNEMCVDAWCWQSSYPNGFSKS